MINSTWYCAILEMEVRPAIHRKCRGVLSIKVVLHSGSNHGNDLKTEICIVFHPAYNPSHVIYTFLDYSNIFYMDRDLQMMKRPRMRCIDGFTHNQKHSSQMTSGSS
jgi:hypothetical protein